VLRNRQLPCIPVRCTNDLLYMSGTSTDWYMVCWGQAIAPERLARTLWNQLASIVAFRRPSIYHVPQCDMKKQTVAINGAQAWNTVSTLLSSQLSHVNLQKLGVVYFQVPCAMKEDSILYSTLSEVVPSTTHKRFSGCRNREFISEMHQLNSTS
jgi:hypothetical protein